ncbi:hypothetical protein SAMN02745194_04423 [Roseomonas rosea]|uniref:Uncharacterized protein n=1 Tax=Muricoccus roseus TaxID=198092 RepID=A0A1M6QJE6_9PROT|nr:hypothetical protein [Roseomonas rosea]SHK20295.1 hypothetical protein SAMN02745194_04423 [Roseomonas rosea]
MRQDTDVARMAAALRTPSLKYRSFGNEPVRNPQPAPPPSETTAFSALGDALAGASDLPPDTVLGGADPLPPLATKTPVLPEPPPLHGADLPAALEAAPSAAPNPHAVLHRAPVAPEPLPQATVPQPPRGIAPTFAAPPLSRPVLPTAEPAGQSLLQVLLGGQVPPAPSQAAPALPTRPAPQPAAAVPPLPIAARPVAPAPIPPASVAPAPTVPAPVASAPMAPAPVAPAPLVAPAALPSAPPLVPQAPVLSMLAELGKGPAALPPMRVGGSTGSSLLDALMGFGPGAASTPIHYPLLDALGDAMRGTTAEPSPRHWPAARVDIALPELLRRVAAGVRLARSAA